MKFSLREIFLVIVICGLTLGWVLDRHRPFSEEKAALEKRREELLPRVLKFEQEMKQQQAQFEQAEKKMVARENEYFEMVARYKEELDKLEKEKAELRQ